MGRADRADAGQRHVVPQGRRKQRVRHDRINRSRPGSGKRLCAGHHGAAGGNDIINHEGRAAGDQAGFVKTDFDRTIAAARLLRNCMAETDPVREIADPRPRTRHRDQ